MKHKVPAFLKGAEVVGYLTDLDGNACMIYKTTDLSGLTTMTGNRSVKPAHVNQLRASIRELNLPIPILVNELGEKIDGQHRAEAYDKEGLPALVMVCNGLGLKHVQVANSFSNNWGPTDFMNSYAENGVKAYTLYREFYQHVRFNHTVCIGLITGRMSRNSINVSGFKEGTFKFTKVELRSAMKSSIMLNDFAKYRHFNSYNFVEAMYKVMALPGYEHKRMVKKITENVEKFGTTVKSIVDYKIIFEDLFNHARPSELWVEWVTRKELMESKRAA